MSKEFVPYKEAKELKKLGFKDFNKFGSETSLYDKKGNFTFYVNYGVMGSGLSDGYISAPLYQQVFRWLRNTKTLDYHVDKIIGGGSGLDEVYIGYVYKTTGTPGDFSWSTPHVYDTFEEAEFICLKKLIKILKTQKK